MAFCDFVISYDPDKDSEEEITKRILYSIIIKRLKHKKSAVIGGFGDSGEGKSWGFLRMQELLCQIQGLDIKKFLSVMNVYIPIQYPEKLQQILFDKEFKKANMLCIHEGRDVINAKMWHTFLARAISDVNAQSRRIKRLCIMIISQFIRDITTDIRYTLNYYMKFSRPLGRKTRLYIYVMWKDDRDLEKPKLRKRKLQGYLVYPSKVEGGKPIYRRFIPKYFILNKPAKDVIEEFEKNDFEAKSGIIRHKLERLIKEMSIDVSDVGKKVDSMVEFYSTNIESLNLIGKRRGKQWKIKPQVRDMHDLTHREMKLFEEQLQEKLKEVGII